MKSWVIKYQLGGKTYLLLDMLAREEIVSKDAIREAIYEGRAMSRHSIDSLVNNLRRKLAPHDITIFTGVKKGYLIPEADKAKLYGLENEYRAAAE